MSAAVIKIIDEHLNGHGRAVYEAAANAGFDMALNEEGRLDIADACALVSHESIGGQNIFGADFGTDIGDEPPYAHHPVTYERVQALRDGGEYTHGMNGIGLTQLTWWEYVEEAERRGGAHLPEHQCSVGFETLKSHVDALGYDLGIGAYNAGYSNAQLGIDNGYHAKVTAEREKWKELLRDSPGTEEEVPEKKVYPTTNLSVVKGGWLYDEAGKKWIKVPALKNAALKTDKDGWLYVPQEAAPAKKRIADPGSGWYVEKYPTHHDFDPDVMALVLKYEAMFAAIYLCTYEWHPPVLETRIWEPRSFDVWGLGGRGFDLDPELGDLVFDAIFNDPDGPLIEWIIYKGWMWSRSKGWEVWDPPEDGSDPGHWRHIHVSYAFAA